jgi:hypothetical protein
VVPDLWFTKDRTTPLKWKIHGGRCPTQDGSFTIMSNETKDSLREKLAQARNTLDAVNDPAARAFIG